MVEKFQEIKKPEDDAARKAAELAMKHAQEITAVAKKVSPVVTPGLRGALDVAEKSARAITNEAQNIDVKFKLSSDNTRYMATTASLASNVAGSGFFTQEQRQLIEKSSKQIRQSLAKSVEYSGREADEFLKPSMVSSVALQQYVRLSAEKREEASYFADALRHAGQGDAKKAKGEIADGFAALEKAEMAGQQKAKQVAIGQASELQNSAVKLKWQRVQYLQEAKHVSEAEAKRDPIAKELDRVRVEADNYLAELRKSPSYSPAQQEKHDLQAAAFSVSISSLARAIESSQLSEQAMGSNRFSGSDKKNLAAEFEENSNKFLNMATQALDDAKKGNKEAFKSNVEKSIVQAFRERANIISDTEGFKADDQLRESLRAITSIQRNAMLSMATHTKFSETLFRSAERNYSRAVTGFLFVNDAEACRGIYSAAVTNFSYARKLGTVEGNERKDLLVLYGNSEKDLDYRINRDVKATEAYKSVVNAGNIAASMVFPLYGIALSAHGLYNQYAEVGKVRATDAFLFAAGMVPLAGLGGKLAAAGVRGAGAVRAGEAAIGAAGLATGTVLGMNDAYSAYKAGKGVDAIIGAFSTLYPVGHIGVAALAGRRAAGYPSARAVEIPAERIVPQVSEAQATFDRYYSMNRRRLIGEIGAVGDIKALVRERIAGQAEQKIRNKQPLEPQEAAAMVLRLTEQKKPIVLTQEMIKKPAQKPAEPILLTQEMRKGREPILLTPEMKKVKPGATEPILLTQEMRKGSVGKVPEIERVVLPKIQELGTDLIRADRAAKDQGIMVRASEKDFKRVEDVSREYADSALVKLRQGARLDQLSVQEKAGLLMAFAEQQKVKLGVKGGIPYSNMVVPSMKIFLREVMQPKAKEPILLTQEMKRAKPSEFEAAKTAPTTAEKSPVERTEIPTSALGKERLEERTSAIGKPSKAASPGISEQPPIEVAPTRERGIAELHKAEVIKERYMLEKRAKSETSPEFIRDEDVGLFQSPDFAKRAKAAGKNPTELIKAYREAYEENSLVEARMGLFKSLGIFKEMPDGKLQVFLQKNPEFFDVIVRGRLEEEIARVPGFKGAKMVDVTAFGGARGAYGVEVKVPEGYKNVFVKLEDILPASFGADLVGAQGLLPPVIYHENAKGTPFSYKVKHLGEGEGSAMQVEQRFGFMLDMKDYIGQTVKVGAAEGKMLEGKVTSVAMVKEAVSNPNEAMKNAQTKKATEKFWEMSSTKEGREELFGAWNAYLERSRRALLADRYPKNTAMVVIESEVNGKRVETLTFQPIDTDPVGTHIGAVSKKNARGESVDVPDFRLFHSDLVGSVLGGTPFGYSELSLIGFMAKASDFAFKPSKAGTHGGIVKFLTKPFTIEELVKAAQSETAAKGGMLLQDSKKTREKIEGVMRDYQGSISFGHDPFAAGSHGKVVGVGGQNRPVIEEDGRFVMDAVDREVLVKTYREAQKGKQMGELMGNSLTSRYADYLKSVFEPPATGLVSNAPKSFDDVPQLREYRKHLEGVWEKIKSGGDRTEFYQNAAKNILASIK